MISWIWVPVSVLGVLLAIALVIAVRLCSFALARTAARGWTFKDSLKEVDLAGLPPDDPAVWAVAHAGEDWTLQTPDGLRLMAYAFPAAAASDRWAVLVHGYTASAVMAFPWARRFHARGFNVLAIDCRAHGRSEGGTIGMGWMDRRDLVGWTRLIAERHPAAKIVFYGVSMGAATVMMASGEQDLPSQVACIVEDCGYTSVYRELAHRMYKMFRLPAFPLLPLAGLVNLVQNGYSLFNASSVRQLGRSRLPMMFIHGEADDFVPFAMVHPLFNAAKGEKVLYTVPGAGHGMSSTVDPQYWPAVFSFIEKHVPEGVPAS